MNSKQHRHMSWLSSANHQKPRWSQAKSVGLKCQEDGELTKLTLCSCQNSNSQRWYKCILLSWTLQPSHCIFTKHLCNSSPSQGFVQTTLVQTALVVVSLPSAKISNKPDLIRPPDLKSIQESRPVTDASLISYPALPDNHHILNIRDLCWPIDLFFHLVVLEQ